MVLCFDCVAYHFLVILNGIVTFHDGAMLIKAEYIIPVSIKYRVLTIVDFRPMINENHY